jgi:hypothetical protein
LKIKTGDIVELQPTDNRNRQLINEEKKRIWEVLKTSAQVQGLGNVPGVLILHRVTKHERWVPEDDIAIIDYVETQERI